jgi:hypothetical protein
MFPLTRPYRQAIATLLLVGLTVVPTAYVGLTAWRINRPGHIRDVEVELSRQLGMQVTLDAVRYPRPGEVLYQGMVARQEEPRQKGLTEVARAAVVRLQRSDRELTVEAEGLHLRGDSPRLAIAQLGGWLQRTGGAAVDRINISAPSCTVDLGNDSLKFTLREVAGTIQLDPTVPSVLVSYRLAEPGATSRCEFLARRDRSSDPVVTTAVVKTMEGLPLPARVLDVFFDTREWLGDSARIDGELSLSQTEGREWEASFKGNLVDVDLNTLLSRRFPSHHLNGRARVTIRSARWADRPGQGLGWVQAEGELATGPGSIGLDLLQALSNELKFRLPNKLARQSPSVRIVNFLSLGLSFAISETGEIRFGGALGNEFAPGVVMTGQTNPLLYAPDGVANVRGLIKTLVPVAAAKVDVLVPLTPESRILMALPVPPDLASKTSRPIDGN